MIRNAVVALAAAALVVGCAQAEARKKKAPAAKARNISKKVRKQVFNSPIKTLDGADASLDKFEGKALLVVNVASKCGLTPQYAQLEEVHKQYADKGFTVVGFPCNQFGGQEPGTAEEIKTFCARNYGVTFPMMEKIEVNGDGRHPIYTGLTSVPDAEGKAGDIQWNFEKFVISADRKTITRFRPRTVPDAPEVIAAIEAGLPKKAK